jgi:hypothetical protein
MSQNYTDVSERKNIDFPSSIYQLFLIPVHSQCVFAIEKAKVCSVGSIWQQKGKCEPKHKEGRCAMYIACSSRRREQ